MKKKSIIFLACLMLFAFSIVAISYYQQNSERSFVIAFNGVPTEYNSVYMNNTHYVPMRMAFEKMGASVFFRERDSSIMTLTSGGDTIIFTAGASTLTVNGEERTLKNPPSLIDGSTYVPVELISSLFWTDEILCENDQLNIKKEFTTSDYQNRIKEVLAESKSAGFNPEKFKDYINYHVKNPAYSIGDVIFRVNIGLDYPFYENIKTIENPNELLVLVNKYNQLPSGFSQYNLVNMKKEHTSNDGKQYLLEGGAYEKYIQMSDAAKKAGLSMRVVSAYRTEDYQRNLYNRKVKTSGKVYADNYSARAGHSEHQTGLAVDINSTSGTFDRTAEFRWMQQHAHEYGFIMRYPKGKEWITGYSYEPWHYRYVGVDVATKIHEEGITYEEYCAKYVFASEYK